MVYRAFGVVCVVGELCEKAAGVCVANSVG